MKKLKISLLAVVFTVGIGTAIVQKIHAAPKLVDATYHWQKYLANGVTRDMPNDRDDTILGAEDVYGCEGTGNRCAVGTKIDSGDGPTTQELKFN